MKTVAKVLVPVLVIFHLSARVYLSTEQDQVFQEYSFKKNSQKEPPVVLSSNMDSGVTFAFLDQ